MNSITFVALDVHKDSIAVAVARSGRQEPEQVGVIPNTPEAVARVLRKLDKPENLEVCYEAGPCGYAIYRQLSRMGISCVVVAPSLIPKKPGERVKTDRRDALKLARLPRSGDLTPVRAPGEDQEAMRDLVRARESAKQDVQRKRNELGKFLLRYDLRPPKGTNPWTRKHRQWLESLQMTREPQQVVLRDYLHALDEAVARLQRLEQEVGEWTPRYCDPEMLKALQAMRGVQLVTAATILAELGDIEYFRSPAQLMSFIGLVPSEHSSGGKERRGSITKNGNAHVRRIVVEAAWHYRHIPSVGAALKKRQEGVPEEVKAIAWKAQNRLNKKYRRMVGRGKLKTVTAVAMARELMGFIWAIAQEVARRKLGKRAA